MAGNYNSLSIFEDSTAGGMEEDSMPTSMGLPMPPAQGEGEGRSTDASLQQLEQQTSALVNGSSSSRNAPWGGAPPRYTDSFSSVAVGGRSVVAAGGVSPTPPQGGLGGMFGHPPPAYGAGGRQTSGNSYQPGGGSSSVEDFSLHPELAKLRQKRARKDDVWRPNLQASSSTNQGEASGTGMESRQVSALEQPATDTSGGRSGPPGQYTPAGLALLSLHESEKSKLEGCNKDLDLAALEEAKLEAKLKNVKELRAMLGAKKIQTERSSTAMESQRKLHDGNQRFAVASGITKKKDTSPGNSEPATPATETFQSMIPSLAELFPTLPIQGNHIDEPPRLEFPTTVLAPVSSGSGDGVLAMPLPQADGGVLPQPVANGAGVASPFGFAGQGLGTAVQSFLQQYCPLVEMSQSGRLVFTARGRSNSDSCMAATAAALKMAAGSNSAGRASPSPLTQVVAPCRSCGNVACPFHHGTPEAEVEHLMLSFSFLLRPLHAMQSIAGLATGSAGGLGGGRGGTSSPALAAHLGRLVRDLLLEIAELLSYALMEQFREAPAAATFPTSPTAVNKDDADLSPSTSSTTFLEAIESAYLESVGLIISRGWSQYYNCTNSTSSDRVSDPGVLAVEDAEGASPLLDHHRWIAQWPPRVVEQPICDALKNSSTETQIEVLRHQERVVRAANQTIGDAAATSSASSLQVEEAIIRVVKEEVALGGNKNPVRSYMALHALLQLLSPSQGSAKVKACLGDKADAIFQWLLEMKEEFYADTCPHHHYNAGVSLLEEQEAASSRQQAQLPLKELLDLINVSLKGLCAISAKELDVPHGGESSKFSRGQVATHWSVLLCLKVVQHLFNHRGLSDALDFLQSVTTPGMTSGVLTSVGLYNLHASYIGLLLGIPLPSQHSSFSTVPLSLRFFHCPTFRVPTGQGDSVLSSSLLNGSLDGGNTVLVGAAGVTSREPRGLIPSQTKAAIDATLDRMEAWFGTVGKHFSEGGSTIVGTPTPMLTSWRQLTSHYAVMKAQLLQHIGYGNNTGMVEVRRSRWLSSFIEEGAQHRALPTAAVPNSQTVPLHSDFWAWILEGSFASQTGAGRAEGDEENASSTPGPMGPSSISTRVQQLLKILKKENALGGSQGGAGPRAQGVLLGLLHLCWHLEERLYLSLTASVATTAVTMLGGGNLAISRGGLVGLLLRSKSLIYTATSTPQAAEGRRGKLLDVFSALTSFLAGTSTEIQCAGASTFLWQVTYSTLLDTHKRLEVSGCSELNTSRTQLVKDIANHHWRLYYEGWMSLQFEKGGGGPGKVLEPQLVEDLAPLLLVAPSF